MLSFVAALLVGQVQIISEPTATPTLAAQCVCYGAGCKCGDDCDCWPEVKPLASVLKPAKLVRTATVHGTSREPITLAPDPDNINTHPDLIAFKERHKNLGKTPAAVSAKTTLPPSTLASPQPPAYYRPPPIEQAAMTYACVNGVCQWVPAGTVTQQVQTYQSPRRFRLLPRRR